MINKETIYTKEASKQMKVVREFDASPEEVWKAWTEPEILDQWWAPKPWKAVTVAMEFREGGRWLYYMQGPEGERHYCRADYTSIVPNESFSVDDAFCDENGNTLTDMPSTHWDNTFARSGTGTRVEVLLTFSSEADMNKIIEMGFREGFASAHNNLDALLAK